jgi:hypothetical protein
MLLRPGLQPRWPRPKAPCCIYNLPRRSLCRKIEHPPMECRGVKLHAHFKVGTAPASARKALIRLASLGESQPFKLWRARRWVHSSSPRLTKSDRRPLPDTGPMGPRGRAMPCYFDFVGSEARSKFRSRLAALSPAVPLHPQATLGIRETYPVKFEVAG